MNRWLLIRRMRGPAFLLMFGVTALLHEWHILSFSQSWPLYLVLAGVLALAERAAFMPPDASQMPPQQYPAQATPSGWQTPPPTSPGTSIVPAPPNDLAQNNSPEGGR